MVCTLQVSKCLGQSCTLGAMSNFAKMQPDITLMLKKVTSH